MSELDKRYNRFIRSDLYIARIGVLIGIFVIIISISYNNRIVTVIGCFLIIASCTYHNWRYFSQLDSEEMKSLNSVWKIIQWLMLVLIASSVFMALLFDLLKMSSFLVGLTAIFIGLLISILNLWYPRVRHQEYLRKEQKPINWQAEFQQLRELHYHTINEETFDWKKLEEKGCDPSKIMELKLSEAVAVYTFKKFIENESRFMEWMFFIISLIFTFLVALVQTLVTEYWI